MLPELHQALQQLIYRCGRMDADDIDVRFDAPTKDWVASLTRPTVDLFLFEIRENTEKRETHMQTVRGNGRAERRMAPRRIDLRYMVSALTTEVEDEHRLMWRLLSTLMKYPQLPPSVLPESLMSVEPPLTAQLADKDEGGRLLELWNSLGTRPRPALCYIVTAPLDLEVVMDAPLVLTRTARYVHHARAGSTFETGIQIGGVVFDKKGNPLTGVTVKLEDSAAEGSKTDQRGQFVLRGVPSGPVTLNVLIAEKTRKQVKLEVPAETYNIVLDE